MLVHQIGRASVCLSDLQLTTNQSITLCFVIVRAIALQPAHLEFSKLVFVLFRSNSKRNRWYNNRRTLVPMRVAGRAALSSSSSQANRASLPAKSANANKARTKQWLMAKILKVSDSPTDYQSQPRLQSQSLSLLRT